ncbi:methyltransferase domain-containing protein [Roseovarius sp. SCSIO 43702]|uniref:class I SAM-dependent DNA methyltransferase n=1 Tax=Roseovarius sp. SCSIO 43702 TaxID=2823043 RepID=UPI001C72FB7A|nr:methyltransferase domain-containing protein [Roseovarius sp. SCSIO 43702]QYX55421.1 methyltransferase domain-containing protein [Roseovarius sp. SCSIO 43702]
MSDKFLDHVYRPASQVETDDIYDRWAATYDAELTEAGYAAPERVARALARRATLDAPVLDFGCGTGLSGLALRDAGFTVIDGTDPSQPMLDEAAAKGVYRNLTRLDLSADPPLAPGAYPAIAAAGVLGVGAAPPETFDMLMRALPRDGLLSLSLNDHALQHEPGYMAALCNWLDTGAARLLRKTRGKHLPARDIKSTVYLIEKA